VAYPFLGFASPVKVRFSKWKVASMKKKRGILARRGNLSLGNWYFAKYRESFLTCFELNDST